MSAAMAFAAGCAAPEDRGAQGVDREGDEATTDTTTPEEPTSEPEATATTTTAAAPSASPSTAPPPEPEPEPEVASRVDFEAYTEWPQRGPTLPLPEPLGAPGAVLAVRGGWGVDLVVPAETADDAIECTYVTTSEYGGSTRQTWTITTGSDGPDTRVGPGAVAVEVSVSRSVRSGEVISETRFEVSPRFADDEFSMEATGGPSGMHEIDYGPYLWEWDPETQQARASYNEIAYNPGLMGPTEYIANVSVSLAVRCPMD